MNVGQVDYTSSVAPDLYRCTECGRQGCRLWRKYGSYPRALRCLDCCDAKPGDIGPRGQLTAGDMVPAIPTDDGSTFWGFWSAPPEAKEWWNRLPTIRATPDGYYCGACGAHGQKMWRRFGNEQNLVCADCARVKVGLWGECENGMVPALPDGKGSVLGYFCNDGAVLDWWLRLPPVASSPRCPDGGDSGSWQRYVIEMGQSYASEPHVAFDIEVREEP